MKFFRRFAFMGLVLATGIILLSGCSEQNTDTSSYITIKDETLSDEVSSIEIEWLDGTLNVSESQESEIQIIQTASEDFKEKNAFSYEITNGVLVITDNNRTAIGSGSGNSELSIYLPSKVYEKINIQSTSGTIKTDSIKADSIILDGSSATFQAKGEFKSIKYTGVSGILKLSCITMPDTINVDANSGSVNIALPENNGFTLNSSASSGKIECEFPTSDSNGNSVYGDGSAQIEINVTSGSAKITELQ